MYGDEKVARVMNRFLRIILLAGIGALFATPVISAEDVQVESKIIFNTACARCHEGQCSGRMSFNLPESAAEQHILRHGGELSSERIRQLFEVLRYMKEECSFYPMASSLEQDGVWEAGELSKLRSPSSQAYFVFLGRLQAGTYRLSLQGEGGNPSYCIEIVDGEFDYYGKQQVAAKADKVSLPFRADTGAEYYLRVTADKPVALNKVELQAVENDGTTR